MTIDIFNISSPAWMDNGKCAGRPVEKTKAGLREYGRQVDHQWSPDGASFEVLAKTSCNGCPVLEKCRTYALERPELEGVWGQTTTAERHMMRAEDVA